MEVAEEGRGVGEEGEYYYMPSPQHLKNHLGVGEEGEYYYMPSPQHLKNHLKV